MVDRGGLRVLWPAGSTSASHIVRHDFVFVHCLAGGPVSDWRDNDTGRVWIKDFLPHDLVDCRILTFGYGAIERTNPNTEPPSLFNIGEQLCNDLADEELRLRYSPTLTFVGHGIGGLVIKKALCHAQARHDTFGQILSRTKHVVFLGTPHQGLNLTDNDGIATTWPYALDALGDLSKDFASISTRFNITAACAAVNLTGATDGFLPAHSSDVIGLPNERVFHLELADHQSMSRFSSPTNGNYRRLSRRLKVGVSFRSKDPDAFKALRDLICPNERSPHEDDLVEHSRRFAARCTGTGDWFTKLEEFQDWLSDVPASSSLMITAPSGCGKSSLCALAFEYVRREYSQHVRTKPAVVFLHVSFDKQRSAKALLESLTLQLLFYLRNLDGVDSEFARTVEQSSEGPQRLRQVAICLLAQCARVFIFLDGFNEIANPDTMDDRLRRKEARKVRDDVADLVVFIRKLSLETPRNLGLNVRVWFSSQENTLMSEWMQGAKHLKLSPRSIAGDVSTILEKEVKSSIARRVEKLGEDGGNELISLMLERAKTNFRWVELMIDSIHECPQDASLRTVIERGLPHEIEEIYQQRLEEILALDKKDQRESYPTDLSRNILSILAFARRPLRLEEVQEAVSIISPTFVKNQQTDLKNTYLVHIARIRDRCRPLVDVVADHRVPHGYLRLSHGSVWQFLAGTSDQESEDKTQQQTGRHFADPGVISLACLQYLRQPKYSQVLRKLSPRDFETTCGPAPHDVRQHHFLRYAAKYWYRHLNEGTPSPDLRRDAALFVKSSQFTTVLQVQSLFVVGHFIQHFDDYSRSAKRNLPSWLGKKDPKVVKEYWQFISEWGRFLQKGVLTELHGELDRCFWGSLDSSSFLYRNRSMERYRSFRLPPTDALNRSSASCIYETIDYSNQVLKISLWGLHGNGPSRYLERNAWYIDGQRKPLRYATEFLQFEDAETGLARYDPHHSHKFSLIPKADSLQLPPVLSMTEQNFRLRLGAMEFTKNGETWKPSEPATQSRSPFWDHIQRRHPYVIKSRRRIILDGRQMADFDDGGPVPATPDYHSDVDYHPSWRTPEVSGDDLQASDGSDLDEDGDVAGSERDSSLENCHYQKENTPPQKSKAINEKGPSKDNSISPKTGDNSTSESTSGPDSENDADYQPRIVASKRRMRANCNSCKKTDLRHFIYCSHCKLKGGLTLCNRCFRSGRRCHDRSHQMSEIRNGVTVGVHDSQSSRTGVFIKVQRVRDGQHSAIFHFKYHGSASLHHSPPAIHRDHPLLVYSLDGQRMLFANVRAKSYFVKRLRLPTETVALSVCVHFLDCGRWLYIARFTGLKKHSSRATSIACQIFAIELSARDVASGQPHVRRHRSVHLGEWKQDMVSNLPFTVTWSLTHLYICVSAETLVLYRVPLTLDQQQQISCPSEEICLPRSARHRPIRFFPATGESSNSILLIGCRQGDIIDAPVLVYLTQLDLGFWKFIEENNDGMPQRTKARMRDDPLFEDFDADDDCDIGDIELEHEDLY